MDTFFQGSIVSVIGGNSGIGLEVARQLAALGATVVIGGRNAATGDAAVRELTAKGFAASFVPVDVQDAASCERFYSQLLAAHGRLDYAFNAAGVIIGGEIRDNSIGDIENLLKTNVLGTTYCAFYAYRIMAKQGSGHIINFSSGAGLFPLPIMGIYSSSKFANLGLSEVMRLEGKDLGVRVSAVTPGLVDTPIYDVAVYNKADEAASKSLVRKGAYMISAAQAARAILRGVRRNQAIIGTQWYIRLSWLSYRYMPWAYRFVVGRFMPRYRKRFRTS